MLLFSLAVATVMLVSDPSFLLWILNALPVCVRLCYIGFARARVYVCVCVCVCIGSDEKDVECSVVVCVISRVHSAQGCVYIFLTLVSLHCALRAYVRCKRLVNIRLHYYRTRADIS